MFLPLLSEPKSSRLPPFVSRCLPAGSRLGPPAAVSPVLTLSRVSSGFSNPGRGPFISPAGEISFNKHVVVKVDPISYSKELGKEIKISNEIQTLRGVLRGQQQSMYIQTASRTRVKRVLFSTRGKKYHRKEINSVKR